MSFLDKRRILILLCLFIFSLGLKLALTYREYSASGISNWSDAKYYMRLGTSFHSGDFYPEYKDLQHPLMVVGPMLPLLVAWAKTLTGSIIWPMLLFNCLLSALLVYVLFELGKRVVGIKTGYFMALWSVFHFNFIRMNYQVIKEPLLILLLPLIILCLINVYEQRKTILNLVLSSLLFSVLIHTDERFIVYFPIFIIFIYVVSRSRHKLSQVLLWLTILIVSMIPWTIRNYNQYGELVLLTPRTTALTSKFFGSDLSEIDFNAESNIRRLQSSKKVIEAEKLYGIAPRTYGRFEKYFMNAYHFWKPTYFKLNYVHTGYYPIKWSLLHNLNSIVFYGVFLPFYLAGLILAVWRKNLFILFLGTMPVMYGLGSTLMLIWPMERYRMPVDFLIILVACWFVSEFQNKKQRVSEPSKKPIR